MRLEKKGHRYTLLVQKLHVNDKDSRRENIQAQIGPSNESERIYLPYNVEIRFSTSEALSISEPVSSP